MDKFRKLVDFQQLTHRREIDHLNAFSFLMKQWLAYRNRINQPNLANTLHLGLDDQPSWIVLDDLNVFTWPGFDLRTVPGQQDRYHYGFLPPKLFDSVIRQFTQLRRQDRWAQTLRDEKISQ